MRLFGWFRPRSPQAEYDRGAAAAHDFLARDPCADDVREYWSSACLDEAFSEPSYAVGAKDVIRQHMLAKRPVFTGVDHAAGPDRTVICIDHDTIGRVLDGEPVDLGCGVTLRIKL